MGTLLISLLTLALLLISAFIVLIVLMQRTSQSGGMGAALGGGAAESAFGSDTNNVLTKATVYGIIAFFLVALGLYLIYQAQAAERMQEVDMNTLISKKEEITVVESSDQAIELDIPKLVQENSSAVVEVGDILEDSEAVESTMDSVSFPESLSD